jgi:hypothetical protein
MRFEWDEAKRKANRRKHGVEFADAVSVLDDPRAITIEDRDPRRATVRYARPGCLREAAGGGVRLPGAGGHPPYLGPQSRAPRTPSIPGVKP